LAERRSAVAAGEWSWLRQVHGAFVVDVEERGGAVGAEADASVTSATGAVLAIQTADCAPVVLASDGAEFDRFGTPTLLGVASTGPFFHDNSAATLRDAIGHYTSAQFQNSEAAFSMERRGFEITLSDAQIDDIVSFLEAISIDPSEAPEGRRTVFSP